LVDFTTLNGRKAARMNKADQWSGLVLSILAAFICWGAYLLPYGSIRNPGPGFYPLWLGSILGGMSIGLIIKTTRQKEGVRTLRDIVSERIRWWKVLLVVLALVLYGCMMNYIGFLLVTFLLMAFLLRSIDPQPWKAVFGWAFVGSVGSYLVFEVWMKLRLPKGLFGI
jgi:putative tricarboxylic transport membrane protein